MNGILAEIFITLALSSPLQHSTAHPSTEELRDGSIRFLNGIPGAIMLPSGELVLGANNANMNIHSPSYFSTSSRSNDTVLQTEVDGGLHIIDDEKEQWLLAVDGGIEHIIIIHSPIQNENKIIINVPFTGITPSISGEGQVSLRSDDNGNEIYRYEGLYVWDAFHRRQTSWFETSNGSIELHIETDETTILPITVDPLLSQVTLAANTPGVLNSEFGSAVAVADFNGDTINDLLIGEPSYWGSLVDEPSEPTYEYQGRVTIKFGQNDGSFTAGPTIKGGVIDAQCGQDVAAADFDGDGDIDIAYACPTRIEDGNRGGLNSGRGGIRVHLNGGGSFTDGDEGFFDSVNPSMEFSHPNDLMLNSVFSMIAIQLDDNNSSDIEIVTTAISGIGSSVTVAHVYRFWSGPEPSQRFSLRYPSIYSLSPFKSNNGDSVAFASRTQAEIHLIDRNTGELSTSFSLLPAVPTSTTASAATTTIAVSDFNKDGFSDIAFGLPFLNRIEVYESDSTGGWHMTSGFPLVGPLGAGQRLGSMIGFSDMNGDSFSDLLACNVGASAGRGHCAVYGGTPELLIDTTTDRLNLTGTYGPGTRVENLGDIGDRSDFGILREAGVNDSITDLALARPGIAAVEIRDGDPPNFKSTNELYFESNQVNGAATSFAKGDLNGDGYDDLIVGSTGAAAGRGAVWVYHGGPDDSDAVADWCTKGASFGDRFGEAVVTARIRGLSYGTSLIVGSPEHDSNGLTNNGRVAIFHTPLTGGCNLTAAPLPSSQIFAGASTTAEFGASLANVKNAMNSVGDAVAIGAPAGKGNFNGRVYIMVSGGSGGLAAAGQLILNGSDSNIICQGFGTHLANAGNVDGTNSRNDILVGARYCGSGAQPDRGKIFLLRSQNGSPAVGLSSWTFTGVAAGDMASTVAGVGDVTGDGIDDFAVGAPFEENLNFPTVFDGGRTRIFRGSSTSAPPLSPIMSMSVSGSNQCGTSITGGVDFNRDGAADIAIGEPGFDSGRGRVRVFFGNLGSTIDSVAEKTFNGPNSNSGFGLVVGTIDLRGDGYADVVISEPEYSNAQSREGRVFIRSGEW